MIARGSTVQTPQNTPSGSYPGEHRCRNCGAFVTRDFVRVFGTNDDKVFGCFECMHATDVKRGGALHPK
ncbi:DUF7563 family protein [Haladaptatus salinisoli]|uniref:DUF7563 family protein n=1 Tax=Haladaptatus salinisoli TaxID=2884876 RepID=UPI003F5FDF6A